MDEARPEAPLLGRECELRTGEGHRSGLPVTDPDHRAGNDTVMFGRPGWRTEGSAMERSAMLHAVARRWARVIHGR
jgi:hypothetical protein